MLKKPCENREDILVRAFLVCPNIAEIARKTNISRAAIYRTMEKDSFQKKLARAKDEALQNAVSFLQGNLSECVSTLMQVVKDEGVSPQTRVNACQVVMTQCSIWTDKIDIVNRVTALEETMSEEAERG